ncbi:hypothetical protein Taro_039018 [Colocasia esculenta]|uniref:Uncharacterized protein n=1 Tax=Colocasia esculenta TaxID=4460 RepID=A0A843WHL7_COLES|nr:hypothetical protein [Colocasia esculenta]
MADSFESERGGSREGRVAGGDQHPFSAAAVPPFLSPAPLLPCRRSPPQPAANPLQSPHALSLPPFSSAFPIAPPLHRCCVAACREPSPRHRDPEFPFLPSTSFPLSHAPPPCRRTSASPCSASTTQPSPSRASPPHLPRRQRSAASRPPGFRIPPLHTTISQQPAAPSPSGAGAGQHRAGLRLRGQPHPRPWKLRRLNQQQPMQRGGPARPTAHRPHRHRSVAPCRMDLPERSVRGLRSSIFPSTFQRCRATSNRERERELRPALFPSLCSACTKGRQWRRQLLRPPLLEGAAAAVVGGDTGDWGRRAPRRPWEKAEAARPCEEPAVSGEPSATVNHSY